MATRLVLAPYIESWDGQALRLRLLLIPRDNPLDPLIAAAPTFPSANFVLEVHIIEGLAALPAAGIPSLSSLVSPAIRTGLPLVEAGAQTFELHPAPPPQRPRALGTQVKKHLPVTYQASVGCAPRRPPPVFTNDTSSCAIKPP